MPSCLTKHFASLVILAVCLFPSTTLGATVQRAAFDIGSATIKCKVAVVDPSVGTIIDIIDFFEDKVDFAQDLKDNDGKLSSACQEKAIGAIRKMMDKARAQGTVRFSAVATQAFRDAANGAAFIARLPKELNLPARIITPAEEAMLGYAAVHAVLPDTPNMTVWDIGASSMVITTVHDFKDVFALGSTASVTFKNDMLAMLGKNGKTPNPISGPESEQALTAARESARKLIDNRLNAVFFGSGNKVIGIGGVHWWSVRLQIGSKSKTFTQDSLRLALASQLNKTDAEIGGQYAETQVSNLILVLGYMQALGIYEVTPMHINQADGLLTDNRYWD